MKFLLSFLDH